MLFYVGGEGAGRVDPTAPPDGGKTLKKIYKNAPPTTRPRLSSEQSLAVYALKSFFVVLFRGTEYLRYFNFKISWDQLLLA